MKTEFGEEAAEDCDEYTAEGIYWVPKEARWAELRAHAKKPDIGSRIDRAMEALERENRTLEDVLLEGFARLKPNKDVLGGLIDQFSNLGLGSAKHCSKDLLRRVYEYFLSKFASTEGKLGYMESRVNRNLSLDDIACIASTYHNWRGDGGRHPSPPPPAGRGLTRTWQAFARVPP